MKSCEYLEISGMWSMWKIDSAWEIILALKEFFFLTFISVFPCFSNSFLTPDYLTWINLGDVWQVDVSTLDSEGAAFDLPDGLVQFRMNLVELLVDICQLLGSVIYTQQVHVYWEWLKKHEDPKAFLLNICYC